MAEFISREAVMDALLHEQYGYLCEDAIRSITAADVRPVVRGKWENNHCSVCGMMPMGEEIWECCDFAPTKFEWFMNFCPTCGAEMREGE